MLELRIHGRGGQGVVTMAELLAKAAVNAGLEAQTLPFFGVERRGAAVKACVRLSREPILSRSMSYHPQYIALMQGNMLDYARAEGFDGETVFIVNSLTPLDGPAAQWLTDAEGIARDEGLVAGGETFINVPMLGAIARVLDLPLADVEAAIRAQWQGDKAAPNLAAVRMAYAKAAPAGGAGAAAAGRATAGGAAGATGAAGAALAAAGGVAAGSCAAADTGAAAGSAGAAAAAGAGHGGAASPPANGGGQSAPIRPVATAQPVCRAIRGGGGPTGTWRSHRPILDSAKCTGCLLCWLYCPEAVIDRDSRAIDEEYCKGCGICAEECPVGAIRMVREGEDEA